MKVYCDVIDSNKNMIQWTLFITAFVITAKFVITSVWSGQKSTDRVFFVAVPCYSVGNIRYRWGDSNKYTKRIIYKELFKNIRYSCFRWVHIKFLYNSKFDFTAKSLVVNIVVITRVPCKCIGVLFSYRKHGHISKVVRGWSGGAMVLGKLPVPGRPTDLD